MRGSYSPTVIAIVDYDPSWPSAFERLRAEYSVALTNADVPVVAIEHVGSTSVPGLCAKPVIDCDIVVEPAYTQAASAALAAIGFIPRGNLGIPLRLAFDPPDRLGATHTYVVEADSLALRNHLAVRDVLRRDPTLRETYGKVKQQLAAITDDIDEYTTGKSHVLRQVLAAAGLTEAELDEIAAANSLP